jgi:outer membrane protein assembly factor BamB
MVRPGGFSSKHGYCSCPVLFEDLVIVNGDHDGDAYLVALDKASGSTRWKTDRENKTRSYVTPIIREIGGRTQMILSGSKCVASYDPRNGQRHWIIDGPTDQFVASVVYNEELDLLFLTAGFPELHMMAVRPDGSGNVTDTHIAWRTKKGASYVPSPATVGNYFVVVSDGGVASCFDAESGDRMWMERIGTHYSSSPVVIEGLVYFTSDEGNTTVIRPGEKLDVVAENKLGEYSYASPAVTHGQLIFRGEKHLIAIGK